MDVVSWIRKDGGRVALGSLVALLAIVDAARAEKPRRHYKTCGSSLFVAHRC